MRSKINITVFIFTTFLLSNSLFAQGYSFAAPNPLDSYRGRSITTADLNKDNAPDIITGTMSPTQVNIFLNDGSGDFNTVADYSYPAGDRPDGITVADLNEDTNLDIITANYSDSTLSIFFGSGDGSFYDIDTIKIAHKRAVDVAAAYLDNDSFLDLAVVTQSNSRLLILTGKGDGTFNTAFEYATTGSPHDLKVGDFNNDLDMDIAVSHGGGSSFYIHYNDGSGDFSNKVQQSTLAGPPTFLDVGFMNDDLFLDIVTVKGGMTEGTLDVLINDQSGNVNQDTVLTPGEYMSGLYLTHIDTNTFLDVVSVNRDGLYISLGDGAGGILNTDTLASFVTEKPQTLCGDDLNNDGRSDIIVCGESSIFVYLENSNVTSLEKEYQTISGFELHQNYPNPFNPSTVISYKLKTKSDVNLVVYDMTGRDVKTLVNKHQSAGNHSVTFNAADLASGIYFYRISASNFYDVGKMILMK